MAKPAARENPATQAYNQGLASVLAIVQLHGGKLSFQNANPGLIARIWLPSIAKV